MPRNADAPELPDLPAGRQPIVVRSKTGLVSALRMDKPDACVRLIYCQFPLASIDAVELANLEECAHRHGDYILAGHLLHHSDDVWKFEE